MTTHNEALPIAVEALLRPAADGEEQVEASLRAYLDARGLVMVPREATDEMLEPANYGYSPDEFATLWDAMLAVAPDPFGGE